MGRRSVLVDRLDVEDAVALLRARAFADGQPVEALAKRVIAGDLQL